MMFFAGLMIGLFVGGSTAAAMVLFKKIRGCIGDLVYATDEDGSYTFIQFKSNEVIASLKRGDIVSFNVITQK